MSKRASSEEVEKTGEVSIIESLSLDDKDEALQLVGLERAGSISEEQFRRVRWKLDLTIPPLCAIVYCSQYLDKNVLNYASIMGLPITGQHYNLSALAFYLGFFVWVFPTMYISQRLRLGKYLGCNVVLWGMIMMLHSVPQTFGPFFALRFLLGMLESCVAPILILIISMFYTKSEQGKRISWFYLMNGVSRVFGGFTAYGISFDTNARIAPYKIMYLLTGGLAIVVGVAVILWMPDSPLHATFLSKEERIIAIERIRNDLTGTENKTIKKSQLIEAVTDIRTWLIVLLTFVPSIPNGGLNNFGSLIIKSFGYTSQQALVLQAPIGVVDTASVLFLGWLSDKTNERMLPIVLAHIPTIAGAALFVGLKSIPSHKAALLFANYIITMSGSGLAIVYAYNASNTSGHTKKVTINAMTLAAFCAGNVVGSETFLPKDAPNYIPGKTAVLVLLCTSFSLCFVIRWVNSRLNVQKRRLVRELKEQNRWSDEDVRRERERHAFLDLTDKENPYFVYTS